MITEKDKRNGRIGATVFGILLLLALFFLGLTYMDPPPENGIVVNFGYDATGSGNTSTAEQVEEVQETPTTTTEQTVSSVDQDVVTQTNVDAPTVNQQTTSETQTQQQQRQPDQRLQNLQSTVERDGNESGEGEDETGGGDQGNPNGDPNSNNRTGNGQGNSGDFFLAGGRSPVYTPEKIYDCDDEGTVVIKVLVNRSGEATSVEPAFENQNGVQSVNATTCLIDRAKTMARRTRWQGDASANDIAVGYIVYRFYKN